MKPNLRNEEPDLVQHLKSSFYPGPGDAAPPRARDEGGAGGGAGHAGRVRGRRGPRPADPADPAPGPGAGAGPGAGPAPRPGSSLRGRARRADSGSAGPPCFNTVVQYQLIHFSWGNISIPIQLF